MRPRTLVLTIALALVAVALEAPTASGAPGRWRDFHETGQYVFHRGDAEDEDAKIYHAERAAAYLVVTPSLDYGVLILLRTRCVESVKAEEMEVKEDGHIDIKKTAVPCSLGRYTVQGSNIVFSVEDRSASLRPKPPLIGGFLRDGVIAHSPQYLRGARAYKPDAAAIEALKKSGKQARIQIFFGSWCSFCNRFIPHALKVEELLEETDFSFEYFGLPAPPAFHADPVAAQMGVKKLPTGIIFIDDREVGRVIGTEWVKPEQSLLRYLR